MSEVPLYPVVLSYINPGMGLYNTKGPKSVPFERTKTVSISGKPIPGFIYERTKICTLTRRVSSKSNFNMIVELQIQ